jgi:hypothetical protein
LPVHRSNRCADERLIGKTSYLKMTAIVAAMMTAPATTATELFILRICASGGPVQAGLTHNQRGLVRQSSKSFVLRHYRDAEAIAEAVQRPTMRFVAIKTPEQMDRPLSLRRPQGPESKNRCRPNRHRGKGRWAVFALGLLCWVRV